MTVAMGSVQARRTSAAMPFVEKHAHSHLSMAVMTVAAGAMSGEASPAGPPAGLKEHSSLAGLYEG